MAGFASQCIFKLNIGYDCNSFHIINSNRTEHIFYIFLHGSRSLVPWHCVSLLMNKPTRPRRPTAHPYTLFIMLQTSQPFRLVQFEMFCFFARQFRKWDDPKYQETGKFEETKKKRTDKTNTDILTF